MAEDKQSLVGKRVAGYVVSLGRRSLLALGTIAARWMVIVVAMGVLGWLLYLYAWQPLHQPVLLPAGVTENNPEVDSALLEVINNARIQRSQYTSHSFTGLSPLFERVATPSPTSLP